MHGPGGHHRGPGGPGFGGHHHRPPLWDVGIIAPRWAVAGIVGPHTTEVAAVVCCL